MKKENIKSLLISELKDLLSAEEQIAEALPTLAKSVESPVLREALKSHLAETKQHIKRLEKIFTILDIKTRGEDCEAMQELIQECNEAAEEYPKSSLRDAAIISKTQRIEHYEISVYGTLRTFAKEAGLKEVVNLLQETLDEEASVDKKLTKIAEGGFLSSGINRKANQELLPSKESDMPRSGKTSSSTKNKKQSKNLDESCEEKSPRSKTVKKVACEQVCKASGGRKGH